MLLIGVIDMFRAKQIIQGKAQPAGNGLVLAKGCNAELDYLISSLRASREALVHYVTTLGKDQPLPASRALRTNASRLAEHINYTYKEH